MHKIDATNKKVGRIASEAAAMLMGKDKKDFARNKISGDSVEIVNASKLTISLEKKEQKKYSWYSGYPGGLRKEGLNQALTKKGSAYVLRRAIYGMLPKNKLRAKMIRRLKIVE